MARGPEREENEGMDHDELYIEWGRREGEEGKVKTGEGKQEREDEGLLYLAPASFQIARFQSVSEKAKTCQKIVVKGFPFKLSHFPANWFLCSII